MRSVALRLCVGVCALALSFVIGTSSSLAADPLAPPGSPSFWLPSASWVQQRWLPYRELDLFRILHTDKRDLLLWLNDHRGLGDLVRARHLNLRHVESELMAPWRGKVSRQQYQVLWVRTDRTFTQDHLAVHMFGHTFHMFSINLALPQLLGANYREMAKLRREGLSFTDIAIRNGRTGAQLRAGMLRVLRVSAAEGVREHAVLPDQMTRWLRYQELELDRWLTFRDLAAVGTPASGAVSLTSKITWPSLARFTDAIRYVCEHI
jgi:hypothetical protein